MPRLTLVKMLSCGQGMTTLVEVYNNGDENGPADYLALIDCGGDLTWGGRESVAYIAQKVQQSGARLPNIVISHQDKDHNSLLKALGQRLHPMNPVINDIFLGGMNWQPTNVTTVRQFAQAVGYNGNLAFAAPMRSDYTNIPPGGGIGSVADYGDVHLRILISHLNAPAQALDIQRNASSAVIVVENEYFAVVLPGDATRQTMTQINSIPHLGSRLPTVVGLSIPHHGALRTAVEDYHAGRPTNEFGWTVIENFVRTIAPLRIGASAGPFNRHHHPVFEVIDKFTTVQPAPRHYFVAYLFNCHGQNTQCWRTFYLGRGAYCTVQSIDQPPIGPSRMLTHRTHGPFYYGDIVFRLSAPGVLRPEEMVEFRPRGTAGAERATEGIIHAPAP
ncbi:hypothetical protein Z951_34295 [Streptomyces sp. PRh5]|uniref:hypothetical protein n=1 Tax=Streptomyces sp. PRh5 TaxID=1158056 RepID=UPI00044CA65B|nr:hypothetical protein [Streptomyces sp. PRh5]EXU63792.1 hypothetical protein Z951_34295 [Streptomyces sp. PRh5]